MEKDSSAKICRACKEVVEEDKGVEVHEKYIYHIDHFACKACKILLHDKTCFEHEESFYCELDYFLLFNPPLCVNCNEIIKASYLRIDNYCFHEKCFGCMKCKGAFQKDKDNKSIYYPDEANFLCDSCFFTPKCDACSEVMKEKYKRALGKKYHFECFKCYDCKTLFQTDHFFKHEGQPLCEKCYGTKSHPCKGCKEPILDKIYFVKGDVFHFKCLKCTKCDKEFNNDGFLLINQDPYHKLCFDTTCSVCKKQCLDEYLLVEDKTVHKECLEILTKTIQEENEPEESKTE